MTHQGVGGQCVEFINTAWVEVTGDNPEDSTTVELCVDSALSHEKTAVSADLLDDGQWQGRYEIDVVRDALFDGVYSLTDTLEFGDGITPVTAAWFPEGDPSAGGRGADCRTRPPRSSPTTRLSPRAPPTPTWWWW